MVKEQHHSKIISNNTDRVLFEEAVPGLIGDKPATCIYMADLTDYSESQFQSFYHLLSPEEKCRADAYISFLSRKQYILSHYLLRKLLGRCYSVKPSELIFDLAVTKKPFVVNIPLPVSFNISHSGNKILIGITNTGDIGVDIEKINSEFDYKSFAEIHFSDDERKMVMVKDADQAVSAFFRIWAAKESLLKQTGEGLTDHLKSVNTCLLPMDTGIGAIKLYGLLVNDYALAVAINGKSVPVFYKDTNWHTGNDQPILSHG